MAAARAGYAARGVVYVMVGVLALLAALELRSSADGSMAALATAPLGGLWLGLVALGLLGFALWRALQAFLDADRQGRTLKALATRTGQALSGLIYGALAFSVLELMSALHDLRHADEDEDVQQKAAMVLRLPHGDIGLAVVGLCVVGAGAANIVHGLGATFHSDLDCSARLRTLAKPVGRIGYIARGVAFAVTGSLLVKAAIDADAAEVRSLGGALRMLGAQPAGGVFLAAIAVGLIGFGLFGVVEARYRYLRAPASFER